MLNETFKTDEDLRKTRGKPEVDGSAMLVKAMSGSAKKDEEAISLKTKISDEFICISRVVCEYNITSDENTKLWKLLLKERAALTAKCIELPIVVGGGSHSDAGASIGASKSAGRLAETATACRESRSKAIEQLRPEGGFAGVEDMGAMWKRVEGGPGGGEAPGKARTPASNSRACFMPTNEDEPGSSEEECIVSPQQPNGESVMVGWARKPPATEAEANTIFDRAKAQRKEWGDQRNANLARESLASAGFKKDWAKPEASAGAIPKSSSRCGAHRRPRQTLWRLPPPPRQRCSQTRKQNSGLKKAGLNRAISQWEYAGQLYADGRCSTPRPTTSLRQITPQPTPPRQGLMR